MKIPLSCWFSFSSLLPNLQYWLGPPQEVGASAPAPPSKGWGERGVFSLNQKQNFLDFHLLSWKEETTASCLRQVRKPCLAEPELALSHCLGEADKDSWTLGLKAVTAHEQGDSWRSPVWNLV